MYSSVCITCFNIRSLSVMPAYGSPCLTCINFIRDTSLRFFMYEVFSCYAHVQVLFFPISRVFRLAWPMTKLAVVLELDIACDITALLISTSSCNARIENIFVTKYCWKRIIVNRVLTNFFLNNYQIYIQMCFQFNTFFLSIAEIMWSWWNFE